jgi:hypothetical protein
LRKSDRRAGSFSTAHMIASASLMRVMTDRVYPLSDPRKLGAR